MQDILTDIMAHTHSLGFLEYLKVKSDKNETVFESMADDRQVVLTAKSSKPVSDFFGVFGISNMDKLSFHLRNPEYKRDAVISVVSREKNGDTIPVGLRFENAEGDFCNDFTLMSQALIEEKLKSPKFHGARWTVEFKPSQNSINRLKLMKGVHSEENVFKVSTKEKCPDNSLVFSFGRKGGHYSEFVFHKPLPKKLEISQMWEIEKVDKILNLVGDKTIKIADQGLMSITIDTGLMNYEYYLPAKQPQ